jgi:hypothetical protein
MSANPAGLEDEDVVELGEMLEFVHDLCGSAPDVLADVLRRFVGSDGYTLADLQADLARFAFLLGGDGERLFRNEQ